MKKVRQYNGSDKKNKKQRRSDNTMAKTKRTKSKEGQTIQWPRQIEQKANNGRQTTARKTKDWATNRNKNQI